MLAATFTSQANAIAFASAVWDWVRTMRRAKESTDLPTDDPAELVDVGGGVHANHASLIPTTWSAPYKHPTLSQWAIPIKAWMIDPTIVYSINGTRATAIRNALESGPTITLPANLGGATVVNSFWTTDQATTTTRYNGMATKLTSAAQLTSDWRPAGVMS